ncbi:hypothetical protein [Dechloromonas sp. HYN0024]|uniref:hypothetical protein n=1 Tax=Dechloromonas sp. HYN0024 TaxID=2231055 RepID=UPI000E44DCC3|nr:hypothetical protein [Dechloromonas sp. HYN0024]AXS79517.1 hypothetical protein HYN24_05475 [Dechloromonas sp. HYN0024]
MTLHVSQLFRLFCVLATISCSLPAAAWELAGSKLITVHTREGQSMAIGRVVFFPAGETSTFQLHLDEARLKDFFLSMKEFKCLEGEEIHCHVPYPYANPGTVSRHDLRWLEHSLLFLYKQPKDFGAKLWNGLYYQMELTEKGIVGTPQAIDLGLIGAPPANTDTPPYGPGERAEITPDSRWIRRLTIE